MIVLKYQDNVPNTLGVVFENNIMLAYTTVYQEPGVIVCNSNIEQFFEYNSIYEITSTGNKPITKKFKEMFTPKPQIELVEPIEHITEDITYCERHALFLINEYGAAIKNTSRQNDFVSMLKGYLIDIVYVKSKTPSKCMYIFDRWNQVSAQNINSYTLDFFFYNASLYLPEHQSKLFEYYIRKCAAMLEISEKTENYKNDITAANVFCCIYSDRILKFKGQIYFFENHGWMAQTDLGYVLAHIFKNTLVTFKNYLQHKSVRTITLDKLMMFVDKAIRALDQLRDTQTMRHLIENRLLDGDALSIEFDKKHYFLCMDGVYDTRRQKVTKGNPTQFCSMRANVYLNYRNIETNVVSYSSFYDDDEPYTVDVVDANEKYRLAQQEVEYFFGSIFPNDEVRNYMLTYLSSMFCFGNRDKIFVIARGSGDNGKTVLTNVLQDIMNDYVNAPPTSQLTKARTNSSAASSDWIDNKNRRLLLYLEMETTTKLNDGVLKFLTGGEASMVARALYQNTQRIVVNANVLISCNNTWTMSTVDSAVKNRLVVVPFETKFVNAKDEYAPNEKPKDPNYMEKVRCPYFKAAFVQKLIETFPQFVNGKLSVLPVRLKRAKEDFIKGGDDIMRFIDENYIKYQGHSILTSNIWEKYKTYYHGFYNKNTTMDKQKFLQNLETRGFVVKDDIVVDLVTKSDYESLEYSNKYNEIYNSLICDSVVPDVL